MITNEQIINAIDNGWTRELRALADGKVIQAANAALKWTAQYPPTFSKGDRYRVKPVENTVLGYLMQKSDGSIEVAGLALLQSDAFEGAIILKEHTFTYTEEE